MLEFGEVDGGRLADCHLQETLKRCYLLLHLPGLAQGLAIPGIEIRCEFCSVGAQPGSLKLSQRPLLSLDGLRLGSLLLQLSPLPLHHPARSLSGHFLILGRRWQPCDYIWQLPWTRGP
ncbi:MAG: hypothetical protein WA724_09670 [Candidatus Dormiibacterota bacterium]